MAITSHGYTGAVNNVQWAGMAGSLGFDYVARGINDCKVSVVSTGTRTVRVAAGVIAGGGVIDYNGTSVDITLPNVTSGSKWFMVVAKRVWQTTNATSFTYIEGTATKQLPPRDTSFGVEDDHPLALVRIAAGQTLPAEVVDLRVVGANNGVMIGFDELCLQYLDSVGTVVRIGDIEWTRAVSASGSAQWYASPRDIPWTLAPVPAGAAAAATPVQYQARGGVATLIGGSVLTTSGAVWDAINYSSPCGNLPSSVAPSRTIVTTARSGQRQYDVSIHPSGAVLLEPNTALGGTPANWLTLRSISWPVG